MSNDGSVEIETIRNLLDEIKVNYYDLLQMLNELDDCTVEYGLDDDYKRIIDAIKGIKSYE